LAENLVLIKYARTFPTFEIEITGHTDEAVKQFLVEHQIPGDKIRAEGRGMLWPAGLTTEADEATITERNRNDSARQANRRVEVLIKGVDLNVPTPPDSKP
jgi:outer membrane protein OmpA-like peptidoglycan-associated protein